MPYCPSCRGEYRVGFERCAACDEVLVAELEPDWRDPQVMAGMLEGAELAPVTLGPLMALKDLRDELGRARIACLIGPPPDDGSCSTGRCAPRLMLYVSARDAERAKGIVEGHSGAGADDLELVGAGAESRDDAPGGDECPACGKRLPGGGADECPECGLFLGA